MSRKNTKTKPLAPLCIASSSLGIASFGERFAIRGFGGPMYRYSGALPVAALLVGLASGSNALAAQLAPPVAEYAGAVLWYGDATFFESAQSYDTGATIALNGNLARPGFIVELFGGLDFYNYASDVPGGKVDATSPSFYSRVGYQWFMGNLRMETTMGYNYVRLNLDPGDPENPQRGTTQGFIVGGELETNEAKPVYFDAAGEYSTVFNTYWSRARLGYKLGNFIVGPEGIFQGDQTFNSQQYGGFLSFPIKLWRDQELGVSLSGGYTLSQSVGQNGGGVAAGGVDNPDGLTFGSPTGSGNTPYGTVSISMSF
jgi:hypothetical protein